MAESPRPREAAHPTPFTYLKVAIALAVMTGVEVGVFYIDALEPAFLPIFLVLSVAKFVLVVLFYMHLKFDSRLFSGVFVGGLLLAVAVVVVLMSLFQVLSAVANPQDGVVAAAEPTPTSTAQPTPTPQIEATPTPGIDATPTAEAEVTPTVEARVTPTIEDGPSGKEIFLNAPANVGPQALWCSLCHTIEGIPEAIGILGPELTHIGTNAATRKPGMSAGDYIRESIRTPEAFVPMGVERAIPGLMTTAVTQGLTDQQVDALVAFLLEQK